VTGSCEHGNKPLDRLRRRKFTDQLSDRWIKINALGSLVHLFIIFIHCTYEQIILKTFEFVSQQILLNAYLNPLRPRIRLWDILTEVVVNYTFLVCFIIGKAIPVTGRGDP
jgi:hypothetical protein